MTAAGAITVLMGTVLLRLTLTGAYTRYVQERMGAWLVVTGVVVIGLGLATLLRARLGVPPADTDGHADADDHGDVNPGDSDRHDHDHDHGHDHGGRIGWLLLAPIAALLLVAPPALGSYGVDRGATLDIRSGASGFETLPAAAEPAPMTLLEFSQRAFDRRGASFGEASVQLTGFVAAGDGGDGGDDGGDGFRLARYQIACCASDATPVVVRVVGTHGAPPSRDRWVTVTGTFHRTSGDVPEIAATSIVQIPEPDDPYE